jgi:hypothetical protein
MGPGTNTPKFALLFVISIILGGAFCFVSAKVGAAVVLTGGVIFLLHLVSENMVRSSKRAEMKREWRVPTHEQAKNLAELDPRERKIQK